MRLAASLTPLFLANCLFATPALAQHIDINTLDDTTAVEIQAEVKSKTFYWSNGLDAAIFSTSTIDRPGDDGALTPLRFTFFVNYGMNINHDFSNNFGVFSGLGIKNIGFIEKFHALDSTVKRRVYTLGVPLGIKIGNLGKRNFVMLGGGADLAFHYKEKGFIRRGNKTKTREWFSERTPLIMPNVFLGASFSPGFTIKAQYYPGNFLNKDFTQTAAGVKVQPYASYQVNLFLLSVGIDIHYKKVRLIAPKDDGKRTM
ncbi:hypothetical protein [Polluticoccus soli]|uniref:hypothetical protein n=1 Tax=Polluticoccus soli TaxID=3034150 RepID=UPI0023E2F110|nr:hypothetical protein [Flavipsychrobacter sp. JY13-12]